MTQSQKLGLASATAVIFIWSGFIVFSRVGVKSSLTAFDVTALRFLVAGAVTLPFLKSWWPSHLPLKAQLLMSLCGPGAVYSVIMYLGLQNASAAYGGVFANGSLPLFTMVLVAVVTGSLPNRLQFLGIFIIMCGGALLSVSGIMANANNAATGVALFLTASAILSIYIFGVRHWQISPRQALALVNIPNAILFLPIWYFALPSGMADADIMMILFQALFQGLGPGFLAIILFALAALHLGPTTTAGFSAAVPASAALLAIPVLGEVPNGLEWVGIATVTLGLILLVRGR